jgi:hypothetical protein
MCEVHLESNIVVSGLSTIEENSPLGLKLVRVNVVAGKFWVGRGRNRGLVQDSAIIRKIFICD